MAIDSELYLLKNVRLDNKYENTAYFDTAANQETAFKAKKHSATIGGVLYDGHLTSLSFQRIDRNTIRIERPYAFCHDCNYIMIRNISYENKWYYCFITECNYINEKTTEIRYEIDQIQTYLFNFTLPQCMVLRQHTTTDTMFGSKTPEPISVTHWKTSTPSGEMIIGGNADNNQNIINADLVEPDTRKLPIIVIVEYEASSLSHVIDLPSFPDQYPTVIQMMDGSYYTALAWFANNWNELKTIIEALASFGIGNKVIGAYTFLFRKNETTYTPANNVNKSEPLIQSKTLAIRLNNLTSLSGYTPKNKKVFNSFCHYFTVESFSGSQTLDLKPEFLTNGRITFEIKINRCPGVESALLRCTTNEINPATQIQGPTMASIPYSYDEYKNFISQHGLEVGFNMVSGSFQSFASLFAGNFQQVGAFSKPIVDTMFNLNTKDNELGAAMHNKYTPTSYLISTKSSETAPLGVFRVFENTADIDSIKRADNFFQMYGYTINQIQQPNIHARQYWTYIRTEGINVVANGDLPSDVQSNINQMFNNGIRFWAGLSNIGDFSLTNAVLS